jgi:hypothetical protein
MAKHELISGHQAGRRAIEEAARIAANAEALGRDYRRSERRRVEALLFDAETALRVADIPREPAALIEFAKHHVSGTTRQPAPGRPRQD